MKHPFDHLRLRKDVKPCCRDLQNNLRVEEVGHQTYKAQCKVCGRRHFLLTAEKFDIGGALAGLSGRDRQRALHPHAKGDGGPPPGRKIILP